MNQKPPSQEAVMAYYRGENRAMTQIIKTYIGRSLIIALGLRLFSPNKNDAFENALISSAVIEAYLLYFYSQRKTDRKLHKR